MDNQFACYKKQRENINQEELMVIYDYSTVHEYSVEKIRNLSFMVATSNTTSHENIDTTPIFFVKVDI